MESNIPDREHKVEFKVVTLNEVIKMLDPSNLSYNDLVLQFESIDRSNNGNNIQGSFYKIDKNLPELIQKLINLDLSPLIDKTLRLVFCVDRHTYLKALLYGYKENIPVDKDDFYGEVTDYSDRYISEGLGWYISGVGFLMFNESKLDKLDRDTLMVLGHKFD